VNETKGIFKRENVDNKGKLPSFVDSANSPNKEMIEDGFQEVKEQIEEIEEE
jgi:hypothetical protein